MPLGKLGYMVGRFAYQASLSRSQDATKRGIVGSDIPESAYP